MPPKTRIENRYDTEICDLHGNVIFSFRAGKVMIRHADGYLKHHHSSRIQLVCGTVFNLAMSNGQDPALLISVCEICRTPRQSILKRHVPTHGLCSTARGHVCTGNGCGLFLCPEHALRCSDGDYRCESCRRRYRARRFLESIIYKSP